MTDLCSFDFAAVKSPMRDVEDSSIRVRFSLKVK
jgi:hypothetical protein